jgi:excisionase family DNA binding protein
MPTTRTRPGQPRIRWPTRSRDWSGKTLADHEADRAAVVHAALAEAGIDAPDINHCSATQTNPDGSPRYQWEPSPPEVDQEHRRVVIRQAITQALRWRTEYAEAKARARPHDSRSATHHPAASLRLERRKEDIGDERVIDMADWLGSHRKQVPSKQPEESAYAIEDDRAAYRVEEIARLLGLSRGGTYELVREGVIPAVRLERCWVIPKARFHAWLDGCTEGASDGLDR